MVLCPTQSSRLAADLLPAIGCAMEANEYDWCGLVLSKFIGSVSSFARRFYANGFASGCGGCAIFATIFYLDRLNRDAVDWEIFPRLKVWSMYEIRMASKMDKSIKGDFGRLGVLDVVYGEQHPRDARDSVAPQDEVNIATAR
ncbi:uncharacterized protein LOC110730406 [Chenopodium quinoa]|uniref:uncharacterized protein LOC110730406 n=1 Tax=Chenopodium quinoa TaxID=63459 RepID=UPI000B771526|nr:uncharacterized protein LOC110730406 [Chenopodium quinoa]XP_021765893.1 uncharacterized protein LOC110730406 [Chenopodium quinoa]XP_021765894.1 uncharacterized protein LOC110730406 [Chenopodium quinoa]XP_021765895.1 uncharacterized protein LOC110730406 [Chenopodium quinoa]XP_021765896.1 uncharacterized protein LOC110730406 [Chenopodium quinoa]XP_021765897.1 uncharacterized protein LOC110730406 [Chenopodium quinoa]XP_021765898.1 uncharacterized protein LOC110730406 [Chenopodium quinoa]XP_0